MKTIGAMIVSLFFLTATATAKVDRLPEYRGPVQITTAQIYMGQKLPGQNKRDEECLAYSIFREAGNLNEAGQYAVAQVHINRAREGNWGSHLCQVVHAKNQFSWTRERYISWSEQQAKRYRSMAHAVITGVVGVPQLASTEVLHYHANYVHPNWARYGKVVAMAGPHIFYKDVPY